MMKNKRQIHLSSMPVSIFMASAIGFQCTINQFCGTSCSKGRIGCPAKLVYGTRLGQDVPQN